MSENEQLIIRLITFYGCNTLEELILAQHSHIENLQSKLSSESLPYYTRPRG